MKRVMVVSPGVLPVPPVLGGAVENLIACLQGILKADYEFHYVSVAAPFDHGSDDSRFSTAKVHTIDSINPLNDFRPDNHFELHESNKWIEYHNFCLRIAQSIAPDIIHIHNEVHLAFGLRQVCPHSAIIVHVNDEVLTRLQADDLRRLPSSVDLLLSCSKYIYEQIESAFSAHGLQSVVHEVFYNFVDIAEFSAERVDNATLTNLRTKYGLDGQPVIVFAGRLIEQKGPHLLAQAVKWAAKRGLQAKMLFVGAPWYSRDTNTPWVEYLKGELGELRSQARFTGYVSHDLMPLHYALADVIVVPSIWDDPSPFVAYEAQAMGVPVLASRRGGIPEIVEDRVTGRCIDVFNIPLFGEILTSWLSNMEERTKIGLSGRQRIVDQFSANAAAARMNRIYRSLLENA